MNSINTRETELLESRCYAAIAKRIRRRRLTVAAAVVFLFIAVILICHFMIQTVVISGDCMQPALLNNKVYLLDKWNYQLSIPKRNDIVVYEDDGNYYITRIIGEPGETLQINKGIILINGKPMPSSRNYPAELSVSKLTLGENEFFTLVDNVPSENNSYKQITRKDIVGKVVTKQ